MSHSWDSVRLHSPVPQFFLRGSFFLGFLFELTLRKQEAAQPDLSTISKSPPSLLVDHHFVARCPFSWPPPENVQAEEEELENLKVEEEVVFCGSAVSKRSKVRGEGRREDFLSENLEKKKKRRLGNVATK